MAAVAMVETPGLSARGLETSFHFPARGKRAPARPQRLFSFRLGGCAVGLPLCDTKHSSAQASHPLQSPSETLRGGAARRSHGWQAGAGS